MTILLGEVEYKRTQESYTSSGTPRQIPLEEKPCMTCESLYVLNLFNGG